MLFYSVYHVEDITQEPRSCRNPSGVIFQWAKPRSDYSSNVCNFFKKTKNILSNTAAPTSFNLKVEITENTAASPDRFWLRSPMRPKYVKPSQWHFLICTTSLFPFLDEPALNAWGYFFVFFSSFPFLETYQCQSWRALTSRISQHSWKPPDVEEVLSDSFRWRKSVC